MNSLLCRILFPCIPYDLDSCLTTNDQPECAMLSRFTVIFIEHGILNAIVYDSVLGRFIVLTSALYVHINTLCNSACSNNNWVH